MRDWLASPLSPTSSTIQFKSSSSSDEYMTTDDEAYDIISKATTTEEEIIEEEDDDQKSNDEEEISSWLSILNVFKKTLKTPVSATTSSSSSITSTVQEPLAYNNPEIEEDDGDSYRADEDEKELIQDINRIRDMEDEVRLNRALSSSSIASSTDTDNSTPANSQIMPSTSSKYYQERVLTDVTICWNHGGKKVQVTGEFDNWSASVNLVQDTKDTKRHVVQIPMDLTRDIEFKFIVDGEWRYATDLPHRKDWRGNINNVIYKKTAQS